LVSSRFPQNGLDLIEKEMIKIEVIFKPNLSQNYLTRT